MKEWNLTLTGLVLLAGSFNFGLFLGSLICTIFADSIGRKNILILGSLV